MEPLNAKFKKKKKHRLNYYSEWSFILHVSYILPYQVWAVKLLLNIWIYSSSDKYGFLFLYLDFIDLLYILTDMKKSRKLGCFQFIWTLSASMFYLFFPSAYIGVLIFITFHFHYLVIISDYSSSSPKIL